MDGGGTEGEKVRENDRNGTANKGNGGGDKIMMVENTERKGGN